MWNDTKCSRIYFISLTKKATIIFKYLKMKFKLLANLFRKNKAETISKVKLSYLF